MRGVVKFLLTFIIIIAVAWLGLWWYAESRLQAGFNAWADQQATQGWKITYSAVQRGTSPRRASLAVDNLVLIPPATATGETATITLPRFALRIEALNPLVMHTDFPDKIEINAGSNIDVMVKSGSITASETLDPDELFKKGENPYRSGDFAAADIDILASQGSLLVLHIDKITSHYAGNPEAGATQTALTTNLALDGLSLSPILTRLASIPFDGKISHLALALNLSGPVPENLTGLAAQLDAVPHEDEAAQQKIIIPVLRKWAAQGGNGNLSLAAIVGPSTVNADAAVKFDANLQPGGTANLTADHLDQFTVAIASAYPLLQDSLNQILAQATPYITATDATGQTLGLHITYGPGAVNINGKKVAGQPDLDWNALENPPPATLAAPGDGSGAASP